MKEITLRIDKNFIKSFAEGYSALKKTDKTFAELYNGIEENATTGSLYGIINKAYKDMGDVIFAKDWEQIVNNNEIPLDVKVVELYNLVNDEKEDY